MGSFCIKTGIERIRYHCPDVNGVAPPVSPVSLNPPNLTQSRTTSKQGERSVLDADIKKTTILQSLPTEIVTVFSARRTLSLQLNKLNTGMPASASPMPQSTPVRAPVLIIGAGVAGLTLAQGLRLRSIPFRIFERQARSHVKQGHRFRISRDGQAALDSVLSPYLKDLLRRTTAERHQFAPRYVDARMLDFPAPEPVDPGDSMPLDRTFFRMLASIEPQDAIDYEKEFDSYEVVGGLVQVKFTDGSVARGQLLVGADGIKSRVRRQLQPDRKLLDLERWVVWGRTPLTDDLREALGVPDLLSWCMCLDHESNVQIVIEPIIWSTNVHNESQGKLPDFDDYVYWVVCTASSQYSEQLPKTVQEKKLYLARVSETWHPALKRLLESASHEVSACVPILSSQPDIQISSADQTKRVTLIGDAAHPMSPMGGSGGDTAIQNAADLALALAEEGVTEDSIKVFEARMGARAKEKIEHSFRGGKKFWRGREWTEYNKVKV